MLGLLGAQKMRIARSARVEKREIENRPRSAESSLLGTHQHLQDATSRKGKTEDRKGEQVW